MKYGLVVGMSFFDKGSGEKAAFASNITKYEVIYFPSICLQNICKGGGGVN